MTDLTAYFPKIWQTNEGFKADCPKCGKEKKFYFNTEKEVGICFEAGCAWNRGVHGSRVLAHFTVDGLLPQTPHIIRLSKEADVKLPEEFCQIKDLPKDLRSTLYSYMGSRDIPKRVVNAANAGYCVTGRWWGYIIFPVLNDEGEAIYWQARRFKDREPKFYNPKASYKSDLVYRISRTTRPRRIVLVESVFNALTLENCQSGRTVVMALLGKSLSDVQFQLVMRYEKRLEEIVVALDGDARRYAVEIAGRFWELLRSTRIKFKVAPIPDGEDINSLGREEAFRRIDKAETYRHLNRMEMIGRKVA